jgi:hypothetical protein
MPIEYKFYGTKGNATVSAYNLNQARAEVKKYKIGKILQVDTNQDVIGELI